MQKIGAFVNLKLSAGGQGGAASTWHVASLAWNVEGLKFYLIAGNKIFTKFLPDVFNGGHEKRIHLASSGRLCSCRFSFQNHTTQKVKFMKRDNLFKFGLTALTGVTTCRLAARTGPADQRHAGLARAPPSRLTATNSRRHPLPFGGVIKETATDSTPYWPPRVVPPKGAPNVLLIMTDDQGYGVSGTFGGVIPTPAMDRIATGGLALHRSSTPPRFARPRAPR